MRRLYQQVAEKIRRRIVEGIYGVGERLPAERVLAQEFAVSRPTVREATMALELEGLVSTRTGSGVFVISCEPAGVDEQGLGPFELLDARRAIEGEIAATAARMITSDQIDRLEMLVADMEREQPAGGSKGRMDRDFHRQIAEATQNPAFVAVSKQLWGLGEQGQIMQAAFPRSRTGGLQSTIQDHRLILDALRAHDADAARAAMRQHLSRVLDNLLQANEIEAIERARQEASQLRDRYGAAPTA